MKPILQALVLAERVYTDTPSGKKIIAGTFNRLLIGRVPLKQVNLPEGGKGVVVPCGTDLGSPWAYISLTDVVDGTEINLQFMNVGKNALLFQIGIKIASNDRLATVEIVAPLPPISTFCTEAGTYSLDVVWGTDLLGSHRLVVTEVGEQA
jgi:hypothetical protein